MRLFLTTHTTLTNILAFLHIKACGIHNLEWSRRWRNQTQTLVDLPKDFKAISCRWVFRKKNNEQYKARLVAKGYAPKEDIDYNEIFSPVVKHTSIRMLLAIVVQFDLELEQMDVKTAFLHGELEEKI